jgi:hypothetical protein
MDAEAVIAWLFKSEISPCSADEGFMAGLTFLVTGGGVK